MCHKCDEFATGVAQGAYEAMSRAFINHGAGQYLPARMMQATATIYRILERFCIEIDDNATPETFRQMFDSYIEYVAKTTTISVTEKQ